MISMQQAMSNVEHWSHFENTTTPHAGLLPTSQVCDVYCENFEYNVLGYSIIALSVYSTFPSISGGFTKDLGPLLLTWFNFNPSMIYRITYSVKCGMKLLIHS